MLVFSRQGKHREFSYNTGEKIRMFCSYILRFCFKNMNINIGLVFFFAFLCCCLGFLRVSCIECKSALCQVLASLLTMHNPVHAEKFAKDTALYLGLIGV